MILVQENAPLPQAVAEKLTGDEQRGPNILLRQHPAIMTWALVKATGTLLIASILGGVVGNAKFLGALLIAWGIFFLIPALMAFANWAVDYFIVLPSRVVLITGLFTRRTAMMPIAKVTDMTYEESWLGRILGYGEFIIESAGQDQALRNVPYIPHPDHVYLRIVNLINPGEDPGED